MKMVANDRNDEIDVSAHSVVRDRDQEATVGKLSVNFVTCAIPTWIHTYLQWHQMVES